MMANCRAEGKQMFNRSKKMKAANRWRSRARLVDISKIKLTIIQGETANVIENKCEEVPVDSVVASTTTVSNKDDFANDEAVLAEIFGTPVSCELID